MVRFSTLSFAGLAAAAASIAGANTTDSTEVSGNVATGAFILECESTQNLDQLVKAVQDQGGEIRRQFNSKVFYGISVQLHNSTITGSEMKQMPGVAKVWPVEVTKQPVELHTVEKPGQQRRDTSAPWNHIMTQVDKLHAAGFTGSGIRIGIVDTGVNYTHSALGGCFGKGCRVVLGDNFSKEGKKNDPMDCHGHGTAVAGILAGNDANYVGVVPNATLTAYRVLDCNATMVEDDLVAGWIKAYEDGAQIIVSSAGWQGSGWATRPAAAVVSRIVDSGVPCIVGFGNEKRAGLFSSLNPSSGKGVTAVNAFARAPGAIDGPVKDAPMAVFSTYGPNWDLDIKPTVGAPGDNVSSINIGGGYEDVSGTSFAGPFVGGIMALMAEVRGTFDPVLLNNILISTAVPQGGPFSVAQQGGGLVRAWDAAHASTLVEPASLAFNDTQHRAQSLTLRITNTAKTNVTYHLDALAAKTLYTLDQNSKLKQSPPEKESADIKLSRRVLVLGPGKSASVDISATDPTGLDTGRLPVWSGWISINSSNSDVLTVPYLGLSGSLKDLQILPSESWGAMLATFRDDPVWGPRDDELRDGQAIDYEINSDGSLNLSVPVSVHTKFGTRLLRAEAVPVSPRKWLADRLRTKNRKLNAFIMEALSHSETSRTIWNGRLDEGDYIPVGTYRLSVRALRLFGDPNVESDWDVRETVRFVITKGAGEKACEIYEAGQANIPENALFDSHQECLDVHGNTLVDRPWIPEDEDTCTSANLTEKTCGTYLFCKAHENPGRSYRLKSPFLSSRDCVNSHKTLPAINGDKTRFEECRSTKDESICGTLKWCRFGLSPPELFSNAEECSWAHGLGFS